MGAVTLVLVYCMTTLPNVCQEARAPASTAMCVVDAQQIAAPWLSDHPGWKLVRWRCEQERI